MRRVGVLAMAMLAAACASMSEDQCRRADWLEQGRRDGAAGYIEGRLGEHNKACAKAGITPDTNRWLAGWREGVRQYCTPRIAWSEGTKNNSYHGACRDLDEDSFLRYHRAGIDVYKTRQEISKYRSETDRLESQLKKAEKEDERKTLRDQIRKLDRERARLRHLLETLESGAPK
jgi:hypothetical protein